MINVDEQDWTSETGQDTLPLHCLCVACKNWRNRQNGRQGRQTEKKNKRREAGHDGMKKTGDKKKNRRDFEF